MNVCLKTGAIDFQLVTGFLLTEGIDSHLTGAIDFHVDMGIGVRQSERIEFRRKPLTLMVTILSWLNRRDRVISIKRTFRHSKTALAVTTFSAVVVVERIVFSSLIQHITIHRLVRIHVVFSLLTLSIKTLGVKLLPIRLQAGQTI